MAHGTVTMTNVDCFLLCLIECSKRCNQATTEAHFPLRSSDWTGEWGFFCVVGPSPRIELWLLSWYRWQQWSKSPRAVYRFLWPLPINEEWKDIPPAPAAVANSLPPTPNFTTVSSPPNLGNSNLPPRADLSCRLTRKRLQNEFCHTSPWHLEV